MDFVSNFSDHRSILAVCQLHLAEMIIYIDRLTKWKISNVWNKASNVDLQWYSELVNHRLQDISLPNDIVHCTEPFCHNHQHDLDTHCKAICDCLVQSANVCIPSNSHRKRVAGWNESACLLKQQASFCHQVWLVCGCPSVVGVTATIRKKTKQRYKAEARQSLRQQNYVQREKMGNAVAANCFRDFWKEVKKVNKSKRCANRAPVIDGGSGDPQVAELNLNLYNRCVPSNRDALLDQLHSVITEDDLGTIAINSDTVVVALKCLKLGKSDGRSLMSDHVLRAPPLLASKLSSLFSALIRHGYIAECLRDSSFSPSQKV